MFLPENLLSTEFLLPCVYRKGKKHLLYVQLKLLPFADNSDDVEWLVYRYSSFQINTGSLDHASHALLSDEILGLPHDVDVRVFTSTKTI